MRRFLRDNALSLTMFGVFLVFWAAQSVSGWHAANADHREHHQLLETYPNYVTSGHFVEATAENWESEFLQMSGYVFLTGSCASVARRSPSRWRATPATKTPGRQPAARTSPGRCAGAGWL
jgi:hypothetical protein